MSNPRPPDPTQSNPPSITHTSTVQISNQTTAPATNLEATVNGTVHPIALQSSPPATATSGQNLPKLNRPIDLPCQQSPTLQISDHSIQTLMSFDSRKIASNSPPPETTTNAQNRNILNRPNEPTAQITPTHEFSHQNNNYSDHPDQFNIHGQQTTGKNGTFLIQPPPNGHLNPLNNHRDHFPPLTSNFVPQNRKIHNPKDKDNTGMFTARQNASMPQSPVPTIQQLNSKFNPFHHQPVQINQPNIVPSSGVNAVNNAKVVTPPTAPNVTPSYAARLKASQPNEEPHIEIQSPVITTKQGLPAVLFNRDDFMVKLASKCRFTLIGKFVTTMPKLEVIRKSLTSQLQIKGNCKVTHFNSTHVYIDLDSEIDHSTVWNKERIFIEGRSMRLLVWTPTFTPKVETTFAPVWVVLPELPWHCYTMPFVTKLLEPIGRVLFFDAASIQKTRGSVAKVKVEIDITKPRPPHLWLGFPQVEGDVFGDGRWQELQFESIPDYCHHCKHQGHSIHHCKVRIREEEYQKRKKDQEEKEKDKDPFQTSSSDLQRDQSEPPSQKVNKSSYERGQTAGTATKPQSKHQAIIAAKKTDIRNNVKQVYVPRNATQMTVDFSPNQVPHTTDSLVGQKISADSMRVSNQRPLVNTKNSFDVLIDVDTAEATNVATNKTTRKTDTVQDGSKYGNSIVMTVTDLVFDPVISKNVSSHDVTQTVTGMESTQIHEIVLQGNEKCVNTSADVKGSVTDGNHDISTVTATVNAEILHHMDIVRVPLAPATIDKSISLLASAATDLPCEVQNALHDTGIPMKQDQMLEDHDTCAAMQVVPTNSVPEPSAKGEVNAVATGSIQLTPAVGSEVAGFSDAVNIQAQPSAPAADCDVQLPQANHLPSLIGSKNKHQRETTKSWIEKSFGKTEEANTDALTTHPVFTSTEEVIAVSKKLPEETQFDVALNGTVFKRNQEKSINSNSAIGAMDPHSTEIFGAVHTVSQSEQVQTVDLYHSSAVTGKKKSKKKAGKKGSAVPANVNTVMKESGELTQVEQQQTEEEVRKAKIRAWQDAILAKSYAEIPIIESNNEPIKVLENKAADSIPSQDSFDPAYAITMGRDGEETEKDKALASYVSPAHSGNKLIATSTLEVICKKASKALKEVGRGFYPVTSHAELNNEGLEAPTYFLGDLFEDSKNDQTTPSKIGKSKWNLNAPLFIPNALRQQESQVATESVDSQKVPTLEFPNAPSDEVLLNNLDLHDIRGLLQRQNSPPQELPQKYSSAHPGIIEDGSEYEDEDEESTAYNYMEESRHAGLSPRLDQMRKPKLIKKKRRPLELKKKEEEPKKPKRVQPTRSSKSKSARAK